MSGRKPDLAELEAEAERLRAAGRTEAWLARDAAIDQQETSSELRAVRARLARVVEAASGILNWWDAGEGIMIGTERIEALRAAIEDTTDDGS